MSTLMPMHACPNLMLCFIYNTRMKTKSPILRNFSFFALFFVTFWLIAIGTVNLNHLPARGAN